MAAGSEKNLPDLQLAGGIDSGDQRLQAYRPDQIMDSQHANPLPRLGHRQCISGTRKQSLEEIYRIINTGRS